MEDSEVGLSGKITKLRYPEGYSYEDSVFIFFFTTLGMILLFSLFLCFMSLCSLVECVLVILRGTERFSNESKHFLFHPRWGQKEETKHLSSRGQGEGSRDVK